MYAVIKTGGKQYRVAKDDIITIEKLDGEAGASLEFGEVLMVGEGTSVKVGAPTVAGAKVTGELVEQTRGPKVIAFKKRRRKNSRRKKGHRQDLTVIRITDISATGKPAKQAAPKAEKATGSMIVSSDGPKRCGAAARPMPPRTIRPRPGRTCSRGS